MHSVGSRPAGTSIMLALVVCLGLLPGVAARPAVPVDLTPLAEAIMAGFPTLAANLTARAELTPATRPVAGRAVAGLTAAGETAPPPGLAPVERQAWLAYANRGLTGAEPTLTPFFPATFTDPAVVEGNGLQVTFRPLGAAPVAARAEDGHLVYRDAYRQTDSLHLIGRSHSEEFLRLRAPDAPTRFDYEIIGTSGVTSVALDGGAVRFSGATGDLMIQAPWVVDTTGKKLTEPVWWELGAPAADSTRRLTLVLNPADLTYPLVIDPHWYVPSTGDAPGGFNVTTARTDHTATLLSTGDVLVAGGQDNASAATLTAEIFNPSTGGWSYVGSMSTARYNHTATLLPKGQVLVTGGFNGSEFQLQTSELYDPNTGLWARTTGDMAVRRERHTATLLPNGKVLVVGGQTSSPNSSVASAELYDPATRTWSMTGSMGTPREKHTATLLPDGRVLVAGGINGTDGLGPELNSAEIYSPTTGTWTPTGAMAGARFRHTATLLANGTVLVAGGCVTTVVGNPPCNTALATAEIYTPAAGTWSGTGSLNMGRFDHTATLLPSGEVIVLGGRVGAIHAFPGNSADSMELYQSGAWFFRPLPQVKTNPVITNARYGHTATMLPNGKVLFVSGFNRGGYGSPTPGGNSTLFATLFYVPSIPSSAPVVANNGEALTEGSFSNGGTMPGSARSGHASLLLQNGQVLVIGGSDNSNNPLASTVLYNPTTNDWTSTGNLNVPRYGHTATLLLSGQVLVTGGLGAAVTLASAELYNPTTGVWTMTGSMSTDRSSHTATLLHGGNVLVAGGNISATGYTDTAELYDVSTGVWRSTGKLTTRRGLHTATLMPDGKIMVAGGFNGIGTSVATAERYDPITGVWTSAGGMAGRFLHTANLLRSGRVLVAGGRDGGTVLSTAQVYDTVTNTWSTTAAPMLYQRYGHTATLLMTGDVVLIGGFNVEPPYATAEIYSPTINRFVATRYFTLTGVNPVLPANINIDIRNPGLAGNLAARRFGHTASLLPNGRVLVAGGQESFSGFRLNSAELYDRGLGFQDGWRPNLASVTSPLLLGSKMTASGSQFKGLSEASGGNGAGNSSTNYPLVLLHSLMNEQQRILPLDPSVGWSESGFTSQSVTGFAPGYAMVTVITNGIPSQARIATIVMPTTGATSWYFAEGYTGAGFDQYLTIQNPNSTDALVQITYYLTGASPVVKNITVAANSRYTVVVHDTAEGVGRNQAVSAKVETTNQVGIIVERPMYFRYTGGSFTINGGHNVMGATVPQRTWYFAEGYTGANFDEYLTIMNPHATDVPVTINYYLSAGPPVVKNITVAANSRRTVVVHDTAEGVGRNQAVSAKVETSHPVGIVVERPMYFRYGGVGDGDGHNVMGAPSPRTNWYFAEGLTLTGFDEYLTIMNPHSADAPVTITYYIVNVGVQTKNITVPANSRYTVAVHDTTEGVGRGRLHGTRVETTNPDGIVVERPIYIVDNGYNVMGAPAPRPTWYFAEGYTGAGFQQYLVVLNPNPVAITATITYYLASGPPVIKTLNVPANSRNTATVHGTTDGVGPNQAVSAKVETTHPGGIVVERPMGFVYNGSVTGVTGSHIVLGFAP